MIGVSGTAGSLRTATASNLLDFIPLPAGALRALIAGDLTAASGISGARLTPFFLEEAWLWRIRLPQVEDDPHAAAWTAQAAAVDGFVVGHAGFHGPPDGNGVVEVGYSVDPLFRGRGYAKAMLESLVRRARIDPRVTVVRASIRPDNAASLAVAASQGFCRVGEAWDHEDGLELVHELFVGGQRRPVPLTAVWDS